MEFLTVFYDNSGKIVSGIGTISAYMLLYPKMRKGLPNDFVLVLFDSIYGGMRNTFWHIVLLVTNNKRPYRKELLKLINSSNYSHFQLMSSFEFSVTSSLFVGRYVQTYHKKDRATQARIGFELPKNFSDLVLQNKLASKTAFVLAPAGYGKSCLAKKICLDLMTNKSQTPIFIDFSEQVVQKYFQKIKEESNKDNDAFGMICSLSRLASVFWKKNNLNIPPQFFTRKANKGCCIIADGFDEIKGHELRRFAMTWLERLNSYYEDCTFIIFSRNYAFDDIHVRNSCGYTLNPFQPEETEAYIKAFFTHYNEIEETKTHKSTTPDEYYIDFIRRVHSDPTLTSMIEIPLLLSFMLYLHFSGKQLPENKALLCKAILVSSIGWKKDSLTPSQTDRIISLLSKLSFMVYFNKGKINPNVLYGKSIMYGFSSRSALTKHLLRSNVILDIDWSEQRIKFTHKSFLELCVAQYLVENKEHRLVAGFCDKNSMKEILLFYTHQESNLTPLFMYAIEIYKQQPKRKKDIIRTLYWLSELEDKYHENKINGNLKDKLDKALQRGCKDRNSFFIDISLHLRLTRLLYSDPIDKKAFKYVDWCFLTENVDESKCNNHGILNGLSESQIHGLIQSINSYYCLNEGIFDIPDHTSLSLNDKDDLIIKGAGNRYQVYNQKGKYFKKIIPKIRNSVLIDFTKLRQVVLLGGVSYGRFICDKHIENYVDELMLHWTPNLVIQTNLPDIAQRRKHLRKVFSDAYYLGEAKNKNEFIKSSVSSRIEPAYDKLGKTIHTLTLQSWDEYDVTQFNKACISYLKEKTNSLIQDGDIRPWGKLFITYKPQSSLHGHDSPCAGIDRRKKRINLPSGMIDRRQPEN